MKWPDGTEIEFRVGQRVRVEEVPCRVVEPAPQFGRAYIVNTPDGHKIVEEADIEADAGRGRRR